MKTAQVINSKSSNEPIFLSPQTHSTKQDGRVSIMSESQEAHLKKLQKIAEKESRLASERRKYQQSQIHKHDVLHLVPSEQIEKLKDWNLA